MEHSRRGAHIDKLMRSHGCALHRAEGGPMYAEGGEALKRGGRAHKHRTHRHRRAEGGELSMPDYDYNQATTLRKGGRACHAEGDSVMKEMSDEGEKKLRRGGRAHHRHHREHHGFGDTVGSLMSAIGPIAKVASMFLKNGGSAHRRRHHAEGDEVEMKRLSRAMGGAGKVRKGMMDDDGSMR